MVDLFLYRDPEEQEKEEIAPALPEPAVTAEGAPSADWGAAGGTDWPQTGDQAAMWGASGQDWGAESQTAQGWDSSVVGKTWDQ